MKTIHPGIAILFLSLVTVSVGEAASCEARPSGGHASLAQEFTVAAEDSGACVYEMGSQTFCTNVTKAGCDELRGKWTKNGKCQG